MLHGSWRRICILLLDGIFYKCQFDWMIVLVRPAISFLIYCLLELSITERGCWNLKLNNGLLCLFTKFCKLFFPLICLCFFVRCTHIKNYVFMENWFLYQSIYRYRYKDLSLPIYRYADKCRYIYRYIYHYLSIDRDISICISLFTPDAFPCSKIHFFWNLYADERVFYY